MTKNYHKHTHMQINRNMGVLTLTYVRMWSLLTCCGYLNIHINICTVSFYKYINIYMCILQGCLAARVNEMCAKLAKHTHMVHIYIVLCVGSNWVRLCMRMCAYVYLRIFAYAVHTYKYEHKFPCLLWWIFI